MTAIGLYWNPITEEMLALHEMFRRLGFPSEEIFVDFGKVNGAGRVQVRLSHDGKDFNVDLLGGVAAQPADVKLAAKIEAEWSKAVPWWNSESAGAPGPGSVKTNTILENSEFFQDKVRFILAMRNKGLALPGMKGGANAHQTR